MQGTAGGEYDPEKGVKDMVLRELLKQINVVSVTGDDRIDISGIAFDSSKVQNGNLFVCIKGLRTDGHTYARAAVQNGATAVLVERNIRLEGVTVVQVADTRAALAQAAAAFYGHPADHLKLIGVTGTNGKTTVTSLIRDILEFSGKKAGLIGTNQIQIGNKILPADHTTPESLDLHKLFAEMHKEGMEYVVMEVSSHSLALKRVYGIPFAVGVFTNITQDHLDFHGTMDNYMDAKKKLFDQCCQSIINIDDPRGKELAMDLSSRLENTVRTFSIDAPSDTRATNIKMSSLGVLFDLTADGQTTPIRIHIPGRFSVYNALAATSACLALGLTMEQISNGLLMAKGVKGRAEVVYTPHTDYTVLIDYAHTPDGLQNIISTVREFTKGRVITLFGCGGDRDSAKRPIMGRVAGELSDYCIITSDNPRTEEPMAIIRQIEEGMRETDCPYTVIENRREAIRYAMGMAKKEDCIILAGKGHETYQILGTTKVHFDEREVVKAILESN